MVAVSSRAESEIAEAALWYDRERAGLGKEFLDDLDQVIYRMEINPQLFPAVRRAPDVRRVRLERFPWLVWFYLEADAIRIFALLHTKRDSREWQKRV